MKNTIELSEPMVRILAYALQQDNMLVGFMNEEINEDGDTMYDKIEDEGSLSWYDDEYNNFFNIICDLDEELTKK